MSVAAPGPGRASHSSSASCQVRGGRSIVPNRRRLAISGGVHPSTSPTAVSSLNRLAHDSKYRAVACSAWMTSDLTLRTFTAFGVALGGQYTSHNQRFGLFGKNRVFGTRCLRVHGRRPGSHDRGNKLFGRGRGLSEALRRPLSAECLALDLLSQALGPSSDRRAGSWSTVTLEGKYQ